MAKLARFTFLLDPDLKDAFEKLCAQQDITSSQMMRALLKRHLSEQQPAVLGPVKKRKQSLGPSDR
jgi:antitoxin component of RelBE/YafQ-DinJ toxin-antitoxin module